MLRAALAALSDSQGRNVREQYLLLRHVQRGCSQAESRVEGLVIDLDRLLDDRAGSDG